MNSLAQKVRRGGYAFGTFAGLGSSLSAELCGAAGFDWVLVDLEHGAGDEQAMVSQLQAISSTPAVGLVRVEANDRVRVTKALDAGALGIMFPRIETAADARRAVEHVRYPPGGDRGVALMNRGAKFGGISVELAVSFSPLLIVQIESKATLTDLSKIATTEGVDVLFVGPSDLSWSLDIPGKMDDPLYVDAVKEVARAAAEAGKTAGVQVATVDAAFFYLDIGYRFIGVSGDVGLLASAARATASRLAEYPISKDG
jgi:2-keto-3-deoxy-L-rhamnonate aldolase RhmA